MLCHLSIWSVWTSRSAGSTQTKVNIQHKSWERKFMNLAGHPISTQEVGKKIINTRGV